MRLVFAGTPEFAAVALNAILGAGHQVVGVLTQPDRRAGRGMRLAASPVKMRAEQAGLPVFQPAGLRDETAQEQIASWFGKQSAELMVVAAYGLLLPAAVLVMPRLGCINIHASLLPRWRGAAPIERAILAGDQQTGISIMQMDAGLDTGPVLQKSLLTIEPRQTGGNLRERLGILGAQSVLGILARLDSGGTITPEAQPATGASYAAKISKAEAGLDFALGATELDRKIRAFDPAPGAFAELAGVSIKIWSARPKPDAQAALPPGTVRRVDERAVEVACGPDGSETLLIEELQKPGGKRLAAAQFLAGTSVTAGARFASPK